MRRLGLNQMQPNHLIHQIWILDRQQLGQEVQRLTPQPQQLDVQVQLQAVSACKCDVALDRECPIERAVAAATPHYFFSTQA